MRSYVLLYRTKHMRPGDEPLAFVAEAADNLDHAEEQLENAYPDDSVSVIWSLRGGANDVESAYSDWWASWGIYTSGRSRND